MVENNLQRLDENLIQPWQKRKNVLCEMKYFK